MADNNHTATHNETQFIQNQATDSLKNKFAQLEAIVDALSVALDQKSDQVFKKNTLRDSLLIIEDLVIEIKILHKKLGII